MEVDTQIGRLILRYNWLKEKEIEKDSSLILKHEKGWHLQIREDYLIERFIGYRERGRQIDRQVERESGGINTIQEQRQDRHTYIDMDESI